MEYFESDVPEGDGACSDDDCPCPGGPVRRGTGYLYIDYTLVQFRREYPTLEAVKQAVREGKAPDQMSRHSVFDPERHITQRIMRIGPLLVCEQGARLRNLDLEVASADAKLWWETGRVPLRPTPLSGGSQSGTRPIGKSFKEALQAIAAGDLHVLEHLVSEDPDLVSDSDSEGSVLTPGSTLLHCAAAHGTPAMVRLLVGRGAEISVKNRDGWTPLHWAASKDAQDATAVLIELGADIQAVNNKGVSVLRSAQYSGAGFAVLELLMTSVSSAQSRRSEKSISEVRYCVKCGKELHSGPVRKMSDFVGDLEGYGRYHRSKAQMCSHCGAMFCLLCIAKAGTLCASCGEKVNLV